MSPRRDGAGARRFFQRVLGEHARPEQVTTDKAKALIGAIEDELGDVEHDTTVHANNRVESDHARLKARLRPMRGLQCDRTASVGIRGHAFVQNLRRGHYELGCDPLSERLRVAAAFDELARASLLDGHERHATRHAIGNATDLERVDPRARQHRRIGTEPDPAVTLNIVRRYLTYRSELGPQDSRPHRHGDGGVDSREGDRRTGGVDIRVDLATLNLVHRADGPFPPEVEGLVR